MNQNYGKSPMKKRMNKAMKKFKVHMMYKDGKAVKANTMAEHLALKKKGYGHSKKG